MINNFEFYYIVLYELPGNVICNKKGLNEYLLKIIKNEIHSKK